jgi:hypothetical protein
MVETIRKDRAPFSFIAGLCTRLVAGSNYPLPAAAVNVIDREMI